jgi:type II secretory pathway pseudopilin PulG
MNRIQRRFASRSSSIGGFSLIEGIVATLLFVLLALLAARTVMHSTKAIVATSNTRRASHLARMVMEQFNNIAANSFYHMPTDYDGVQTFTPGLFFGTAEDNMGYDGYTIIPKVTPRGDGIADLELKLTWLESGETKSVTFTKNLFAISNKNAASGTVDVWVIADCSHADDDPAQCPGLSGFQVTAPNADPQYVNQFGKNESWATTVNGHAILRNVKLSSVNLNAPIPVSAGRSGSAFNVPSDSCGVGYYDSAAGGGDKITATMSIPVSVAGPNLALFKNFRPLGQVTGSVRNDDPTGPIATMAVLLKGSLINGAVIQSNSSGWQVNTNASGQFSFCNVVPGTLTLIAKGRPGSNPVIPTTDSRFLQGYTNPVSYSVSLNAAQHADDSAPTANPDLTIYPIGALLVKTVRKGNIGIAVPKTDYQVRVPPNAALPTLQFISLKAKTDDNGISHLFNLVTSSVPVEVPIDAARMPATSPAGLERGWAAYGQKAIVQRSAADRRPADNQVTIQMDEAYRIIGQVRSTATLAPIADLDVIVDGIGLPSSQIKQRTDANGYFGISGISLGGNWGYFNPKTNSTANAGFIPDLPSNLKISSATLTYSFKGAGATIYETFQGKVQDADHLNPIEGAVLSAKNGTIQSPSGVDATIMTDSTGEYSLRDTLSMGINLKQTFPNTCFRESATFPASVFPVNSALEWTCLQTTTTAGSIAPKPLYINPATAPSDTIEATKDCYSGAAIDVPVQNLSSLRLPVMLMRLTVFDVVGRITELTTNMPIASVDVCDAALNSNRCTSTDTSGNYSLTALIQPGSRTLNTGGNVGVRVNTGSTGIIDGYTYEIIGSSVTASIDSGLVDCHNPLTVDLKVRKSSTGL